MKKGLFALAGAFVGIQAYNRRVARPRSALDPQLPATPKMWRWRFGEVAVYEAGDHQNPPLLLLHGHNAAASAAEMREPFRRLSERYHVFAPDLLGYGLSDRPNVEYTPNSTSSLSRTSCAKWCSAQPPSSPLPSHPPTR